MALALRKPSFIRSVVIVASYLLIIFVNELGVVRSAGAPAYPPAESPVSSAPTPTPIESPAFIPVPPPALAPARNLSVYSECGPWPVKQKAYERMGSYAEHKKSLERVFSDVEPICSSLRCFPEDFRVYGPDIIGELVPEIGDLRNLEYLYIEHNPGLTGPIPASIWNLPNLKEIDLSNNSLSGRVVLDDTMSSTDILEYNGLSRNSLISWEVHTNMWNLLYLFLDGNNLSESFNLVYDTNGSSRDSYAYLQTLELSNNYLNDLRGSVSPDSAYYRPPIRTLRLRSNLLTSFSIYGNIDSLGALDLSNNKIGHLPDWSSVMRGRTSALSELILDHNFITGDFDISAFVESNISKSLTVLSLQYNQITNVVYAHDFAGVRTKFLLQGNPYCTNTWPSKVDALRCSIYCEHNCTYEDPKTDSGKSWTIIVATTTSSSALLLLFATLCFALVLRRNKKYIRALQKSKVLTDLRAATRNFAPEMKLGAGAYGAVYKAILPNNNVVAVKLKGYCLRGKQTLLVYEYVDNYDLDKLLFSCHNSSDNTLVSDEVLNWQARMKVCQGVAQGLYYLHASSQSRIIHRDIKASSIMLDKNRRSASRDREWEEK